MYKKVNPYSGEQDAKKQQVATMFDNIAPTYDFLNHFLSMGIDKKWRKRAIGHLSSLKPQIILDVATGTADFAIEALKSGAEKVIGIDISNAMLDIGRKKLKKKGLDGNIELFHGDSENLQFDSEKFDAVTVAFGVRNFEHLDKGLSEMNRVLRPGGKAVILEFSRPSMFPIKQGFNFYFHKILPFIGRLVSKDHRAYSYLHESVEAFPEGSQFEQHLATAGFKNIECDRLTFGICSIYLAEK